MKAEKFLDEIKPTDNVVIIFNNDGDGISSCVLLKKYLEKSGKRKPYIINQPMPMDKNIIQRIQTTVPHKIIFLDIAADQQQGVLKKIGSLCDILIIDHHQVFKNMNTQKDVNSEKHTANIVHYNPRIENPSTYKSTAYCVYKIISKLGDFEEDLWIAGVGMVSDYNLEDSKDVVKSIKDRYDLEEPLYNTKLGRMADMISATRAVNSLSCEQMVETFGSTDFNNFESGKNVEKMIESLEIIEKEISSIVTDAGENMERKGNVFFYQIKSKFNLGSSISTKISENFPKNLIIIYEKNSSRVKVSARNQAKNINAGKVMQRASKLVGGSGGGHEAAAGATIPADEWGNFREAVIKYVNRE